MYRALVRLPLLPHFALIGLFLGFGTGHWAAASVAGDAMPVAAAVQLPPVVSPVRVSVSTLDLARLVPSQFGDWDAPPSMPTR